MPRIRYVKSKREQASTKRRFKAIRASRKSGSKEWLREATRQRQFRR